MDQDLQRYLNDHLAGSQSALFLIQDLVERQEDPEESRFFSDLKLRVEDDQAVLRGLLAAISQEQSTALHAVGNLTGKVSRLKLLWEGMQPGRLGMFEALEMLAICIQGKRLLWVVLQEISHHFPEWTGVDFHTLECQAIRQREMVEDRRLYYGRETFTTTERLGLLSQAPAA